MKFDMISLGDHLPDPHTRRYTDTQAEHFRMLVDLGVHAENVGFDAYWLGEHHCSDYIVSVPQMLLAAVAVQTRRIRLGTGVTLLPNNDPVRLAEDFATLDLLSQGRAEIGFGSGISAHTFKLFGQDVTKSAEMAAENLELIQKLWNEGEINWTGRMRTSIRKSKIQPRTYSGRAIPINHAVVSSMEAARQAGRSGHKLMLFTAFGVFAKMRPFGEAYREAYCAAGHDPAHMSVAVVAYVHVQRDSKAAWSQWLPYRSNYLTFVKMLIEEKGTKSFQDYLAKRGDARVEASETGFCGSPTEIVDKILTAHAQVGGFNRFMAYFDMGGLPRRDTFASVDLFASDVIPHVHRAMKIPASIVAP